MLAIMQQSQVTPIVTPITGIVDTWQPWGVNSGLNDSFKSMRFMRLPDSHDETCSLPIESCASSRPLGQPHSGRWI